MKPQTLDEMDRYEAERRRRYQALETDTRERWERFSTSHPKYVPPSAKES